ncbi:MAG: nucleotidyltransferase domain-containing protein [Deltaproteobacteria bacterium]
MINREQGKIRDAARNCFEREKSVLCAYLFGSFASGKENRTSDMDIAVLFDAPTPRSEYSGRVLSMMDALSASFDRDVDMVVLNDADSFLKFQVLKTGERIYERTDRRKRDFERMAVLEYFDYLPIRKKLEAAFIRGIKEAQS